MGFYEYCGACGKAFASEGEWKEHKARHMEVSKAAHMRARKSAMAATPISKDDDIPSISRAAASMAQVVSEVKPELAARKPAPTKEEVEKRLVETQAVAKKRKRLIAAGIEAATMTRAEVLARYEKARQDGQVD